MRIGYILLSKVSPSQDDQLDALARAGVAEPGAIFVDQLPERRSASDRGLPGRTAAIERLGPNDELVVESPARLGTTTEDILTTLAGVSRAGAAVRDAATGKTWRLGPDVAGAAELIDLALSQRGNEVAAKMRAVRAAVAAPARKKASTLSPEEEENARRLWLDARLTKEQAAAAAGFSVRTMFRRFGPRTGVKP